MESYQKKIKLGIELQGNELKSLHNEIKQMASYNLFSRDSRKELIRLKKSQEELRRTKQAMAELKMYPNLDKDHSKMKALKKTLKEISNRSEIKQQNRNELKNKFKESVKEKLVDSFEDGLKKIKGYIVNSFKSAFEELQNMAKFSSNSKIFSKEALENKMNYGWSDAENYAHTKAMEALGISSYEDTFLFNKKQIEYYNENLEKFKKQFEDFTNRGVFKDIEEFTTEFKKFKDEMKMTIMKFIVENKDELMEAFRTLIKIGLGLAKILSVIMSFLGGGRSESSRLNETNNIINRNTSSKNINVSISNVMNNTERTISDKNALHETTSMTSAQLIKALRAHT